MAMTIETQFLSSLHPSALDLTGKRYGRLVVLGPIERRRFPSKLVVLVWLCQCTCNKQTRVLGCNLRSGHTVSCGCHWRDSQTGRNNSSWKHGHGRSGQLSAEYKIWRGIRQRCTNVNARVYPRYGGRGIKLCSRWANDFLAFLEDMGPRPSAEHSIERKDNGGNYEPGNCRWATKLEQSNNKRSNVIIHALGKTLTIAQWARERGIPYSALRGRLNKGWTTERALTQPARRCRRRAIA